MKWNELSLIKKVFLGLLLAVVVVISPEFLMFINFGGFELALSLLMINLLALKTWFTSRMDSMREAVDLCIAVLHASCLARKSVFYTHAVLSILVILLTCSSLFSACVFLAPAFVPDVSGPMMS